MKTLWIDLETDGHDVTDQGQILEVGFLVTEHTPQMGIFYENNYVIIPQYYGVLETVRRMSDTVFQMHARNGLIDDLLSPEKAVSLLDVESVLVEIFKDEKKVALAGSGVGHFDSKFIRAYMPNVAEKLTYWSYDVGVIRRTLQLCNKKQTVPSSGNSDLKTHRALDDARMHRDEFVHYTNLLMEKL